LTRPAESAVLAASILDQAVSVQEIARHFEGDAPGPTAQTRLAIIDEV